MLPEIWFCWLLLCVWLRRKRKAETAESEERDREKYIAEVEARGRHRPLAPVEAELKAWHDEMLDQRDTDEFPVILSVPKPKARRVVRRNPLKRQQAEQRKRMQLATAALEFELDPLAAPLLTIDRDIPLSVRSLERASIPFPDLPAEPEPWHLESFTQGWTRGEIQRVLAAAKAGPP